MCFKNLKKKLAYIKEGDNVKNVQEIPKNVLACVNKLITSLQNGKTELCEQTIIKSWVSDSVVIIWNFENRILNDKNKMVTGYTANVFKMLSLVILAVRETEMAKTIE